jgi:predicted DNA binding protein
MPADGAQDDPDRPPEDEQSHGKPRFRLEFHSDELAEPFREMVEEDVTIEIDSVVDLPEGTHLQYWTTNATDAETLLETIKQFPTTRDARLVKTVGDDHRIETHASSESLFSTFNSFDGQTRRAVYEDGVHVAAEFPPSVEPSAVVEAVHDVYPVLELVSSEEIRTASVVRRLANEHLTECQLTVLQMAYFGGYFEQPRENTGERLADRLGMSRQAFHEHLRKAYSAVFEQLFEGDDGMEWVDQ